MKEQLQAEGILKEEKVGYLKTKLNLKQGVLYLTPNKIVLAVDKGIFSSLGLLGVILNNLFEKRVKEFELAFEDIDHVAQGKHGFAKNVLEITSRNNITYRILVKNYVEWEKALKTNIKSLNTF